MTRSFGTEISGNRKRGFELTSEQRASLISKREEGLTVRELMAEFKCGRTVIYDTLNRWKTHGTTESLPRAGRPKALTRREQRALFRAARKNPKITYSSLVVEANLQGDSDARQHPPSRATLYRTLKREGLTNHLCAERPLLNEDYKAIRRRFSSAYRKFRWRRRMVKFSDECSLR